MAIELIAKIKQANNGTFKLVDATDVELKDGSDLQSFLDNIGDKIPSGGNGGSVGSECVDVIHQGDTEPTDENIILWVDTSEEEGEYTGELEDKVILEFREMFKYLTGKIEELQAKNIELEARILYLEEYGGGISKPETPSSDNVIMTFEDGSMLVDENGILLALETISTASNETKLTFETGEILVDEENNILILEK